MSKPKYIVDCQLLNVRFGVEPSVYNIVIRRLKKGHIVKVKEYWNEWARIGPFQWVKAKYLKRIWDNG